MVRFPSDFLLSHVFSPSVSWFLLCEVHRSFVKSIDREMWGAGSLWLINEMKSDFLLYVIFRAFIIMKTYQIFCELHRSFVKSIDRILSDAETPSFVIGNDPDFFIISIFFLDCDMECVILCTWFCGMSRIWRSKYHIQQKVRFHSINCSRSSSSSHFAIYGVHKGSMDFTK